MKDIVSIGFSRTLLYALILIGSVFLISPFFAAIVLSAIIASIILNLKHYFPQKLTHRKNLFAAVSVLLIFLCIIVPLATIMLLLGLEATRFVEYVQTFVQNASFTHLLEQISTQVNKLQSLLSFLPISLDPESLRASALKTFEGFGNALYASSLSFVTNIAGITLNTFFFLFISFFFVRDGEEIIGFIKSLLPFDNKETQALIDAVEHVGQTVILGSIAASLVLGVCMTGIYTVFQFPSPLVWGLLIALLSLVPVIGTWLVYIPSIIFLFLTAPWYIAVIFILVIIFVDSFLFYAVIRPRFLDAKTQLYPLAIFMGIVGGISIFGPIGIVYGPLLMTLCITTLRQLMLLKQRARFLQESE